MSVFEKKNKKERMKVTRQNQNIATFKNKNGEKKTGKKERKERRLNSQKWKYPISKSIKRRKNDVEI